MNRLITTLMMALLLLVVGGCDRDYLGPDQQDITSDDFFTTERSFDQAALGIYQKLVFFYIYGGNANNWLGVMRWMPGDDATTSGNNAFEIFGNLNAANGRVGDFYRNSYQLIARANTLLEKQEELGDEAYTNQDLRDTHRGEALFLRGYAYFWLWQMYGPAPPLVLDRIVTQEGFFPPSAGEGVLLDQAISDMEEAKDLLPETWPEGEVGRATQNSANGYLGKLYLYRATVNNDQADYEAAIEAFDRVQGVSLMEVYGDNFDETIENNAESIWEIQLGSNTGGNDNVWLSNDQFNVVGNISGYWGYFDNNFGQFGIPRIVVTEPLKEAFEEGDPRIASTYDPNSDHVLKYVARPRTNGGNPNYYNNHRELRYADLLLMKAEALVQSGGDLSQALELVNQVRTRARNSDTIASEVPANFETSISDRDQVMQIVMEERERELALEGHRWFDLRRWHLGGIIDIGQVDFGSIRDDFDFDPDVNIQFPLPASQVTNNPNLVQNPGY